MLDYLRKYNKLPKGLRDKMSAPAVIAAIEEIEKKYGVSLAATVMKVMVKDIDDVVGHFMEEFKLSEEESEKLADELKEKVFAAVADYLGPEWKTEKGLASASREGGGRPAAAATKRALPSPSEEHSDFFFSREDEKEIGELAKKVGDYAKDSSRSAEAEKNIEQIIGKARISFGSQELAERFKRILKIYLRGVRDRIDTKQTLVKPIESGGLGIDIESADNILSIADGSLKSSDKDISVKKPKKISVEEDLVSGVGSETPDSEKNVGIGDVGYDFAANSNIKKPLAKLDTARELAPPAPSIVKKGAAEARKEMSDKRADARPGAKQDKNFRKPGASILRKFYKKEKADSASDPKPSEEPSAPSRQSGVFAEPGRRGKIKMEDVKTRPKIMGPIDELRYMRLIDFRRLDDDPFKAAEKIKEKISLLDDEYSKRAAGIKAWRLSPVNRLYLKMGAAGISHKKPIDAIMEERKSAGKDYLNNREFEAIIKLNKELRF